MKCNMDCLNCVFSDCILDDDTTDAISDVIEYENGLQRAISKGNGKAYRYYYSDKGKAYREAYRKSEHGKEVLKKAQDKYNKSDKAKERWQRYYKAHKEELKQRRLNKKSAEV